MGLAYSGSKTRSERTLKLSMAKRFTNHVIQVMTYYVVYIFSMAGLSNNVNLISSGVQYAIFIVGTTIMFFLSTSTRLAGYHC